MNSVFFDFYLFPAPEEELPASRLSGQNARHILAVYEGKESGEEIKAFLGKILSAVNLDVRKDVFLLNLTSSENISFSSLKRKHIIEYILIFGIQPQQLGLHMALPLYRVISHNDMHFLRAHHLSEIYEERQEGGKEKAGALWKALKELFLKPETE